MNVAALAIVMACAFAAFALVLNHAYARVALVELALNEGLPPGQAAQPLAAEAVPTPLADPITLLDAGVHVFLSRNCHACQRLVDELDQAVLDVQSPLHLHYVDRPRPIARSAAEKLGATLDDHQAELTARLGADPLPYTIAIGEHDLIGRSVTPTVQQLIVTARDAGIQVT